MSSYDLILRNADIATVGDRYRADIGVRDGRICAIAQGLDAGARARSTRPAAWSRPAASTAIATSTSRPATARASPMTSSPARAPRPAAAPPP